MVRLEHLLTITAVVPAAIMSAVHPDLQEEPPHSFRKLQEKKEVNETEKRSLTSPR